MQTKEPKMDVILVTVRDVEFIVSGRFYDAIPCGRSNSSSLGDDPEESNFFEVHSICIGTSTADLYEVLSDNVTETIQEMCNDIVQDW